MSARPAKAAVFEQLAADGVRHLFGNPGTVEQGLLDLAGDSEVGYVLALHESVAVAMADGYARAAQRPGVVQLHSAVGLGNAVGMLYQARRGGSPLVVLAGEAGVRYAALDAQMAADLVAIAQPVTKYAARVLDASSVLRELRRAVKIAMTPPRGPVLVVLPADVLEQPTAEPAVPASVPHTRAVPEPAALARAAALLAGGARPLILMGDGVAASGAQQALTRVAEALGAPVWGVNSSEVNFDATHRLFGGLLGHMFGADSARVVGGADAVLIVGTYVFPEVFPELASPFAQGAAIVHIDADAYEIAKNFPVDLGLAADPALALDALAEHLAGLPGRAGGAREPQAAHAPTAAAPVQGRGRARQADGAGSLMECFARELAAQAPPGLVVFDEALTACAPLLRHLPPRRAGGYFQTRGGSLGVGIPGALGAKLARPELPVVAFTGDGASMYTIQALWSAARYRIGAKFVICNNRRYQLLDDNIERYWAELGIAPRAHPEAFDLSGPDIDFTALAGALGVPGRRVDKPGQVPGAVRALLAHRGPYLVDLDTA
ncbi:Benzoylformate decarboxylase [Streptomyces sp. YIM 121038]|uniref:thiamine pyrophosphate-binding protein n=1 Tax=Streptomyces sp. YIM 121038 TaxID=2136401 RepID=UPI0011100EDF|nr:thiamine pyrophosphate-binding protein [Streptomyces sp. YIM 121038]QCX73796.1 Benzoylformate decarboxylase [Streptomyces sp. YIM 121038]QCX82023.1 Benzoylformate decarboxylase [Streptomyces sp. YIM 121038]